MTIFRHNQSRVLYTRYLVSPRMYTGSWYEAVPLFGGKTLKHTKAEADNFTAVSHR